MHLSVVGSLRLHTAAEQQLTRLPLPSRSDEACKLAIFGRRRDQSLKSRWFRGRYASASINAKIGASTSSLNREAFGGQLRSNVFSDADDGGDDTRLVGDDEAELLDTCSKGFASAHARFDNSRLRGLSALAHIVDP